MSPRRFKATVRDEFHRLVSEAEDTRLEYRGREMPRAVGKAWSAKIARAEHLLKSLNDQRAQERWNKVSRTAWEREIPPENMHLPASGTKSRGDRPAGYLELGAAVALSAGMQDFLDSGMPRLPQIKVFSTSEVVESGGKSFVPLNREERRAIEQKSIPVLGAGVIEPERLPVVPQVLADMDLRIRDVIPISRTSSDQVSYMREESYTPGAEVQTPGEPKGEAALEYTAQTAPVLTLAVHIPALVQQLADLGQLRNLIDNRLRYDVRLLEESEMIYGIGGPANFEGLAVVANTHDIATADARVTTPTVLDSIRVGITEVRRAGYAPDTLLIDPIDLEEILLLKADTEGQYVGGAFPSSDAGPGFRVWGLRVVETQAMEASNGGRQLIVMDAKRAATLVVRTELEVLIGMIEDDFVRNKRRLLAETRSAFVIYAPQAIAKLETAAGGS